MTSDRSNDVDIARFPLLTPALVGSFVAGGLLAFVAFRFPDQLGLDLSVYRGAVREAVSGGNVYDRSYGYLLPFAYPPSALLVLLWAALPAWFAGPVLFAVGLLCVAALVSRIIAVGSPFAVTFPPAVVAGVASAAVVATFPVGLTLYFGQVNLLVATLIVIDVLGPRGRRWAGCLVGVAVAIKLTPVLFLVWLACLGRWREVRNGVATFAVVSLAALIAFPHAWTTYVRLHAWSALDRNQDLSGISNQGLTGVAARIAPITSPRIVVVAVLSLLLVALGLWVGVRLHRAAAPALAVCVVGLTSCAVSPLAWIHHWVWWPLLAIAVLGTDVRGRVALAVVAWAVAVLPPTLLVSSGVHGVGAQVVAAGYLVLAIATLAYLAFAPPQPRAA